MMTAGYFCLIYDTKYCFVHVIESHELIRNIVSSSLVFCAYIDALFVQLKVYSLTIAMLFLLILVYFGTLML